MGDRERYVAVGLYEPTNRTFVIEVGMQGEARDSVILKAYDRRNQEHGAYKILGACTPESLKQYGLSRYDVSVWDSRQRSKSADSRIHVE